MTSVVSHWLRLTLETLSCMSPVILVSFYPQLIKVLEVLFLSLVYMLASSRDWWSVPLAMEKPENIEFHISCYFGVIISTLCKVLRHFIPHPRFHA